MTQTDQTGRHLVPGHEHVSVILWTVAHAGLLDWMETSWIESNEGIPGHSTAEQEEIQFSATKFWSFWTDHCGKVAFPDLQQTERLRVSWQSRSDSRVRNSAGSEGRWCVHFRWVRLVTKPLRFVSFYMSCFKTATSTQRFKSATCIRLFSCFRNFWSWSDWHQYNVSIATTTLGIIIFSSLTILGAHGC